MLLHEYKLLIVNNESTNLMDYEYYCVLIDSSYKCIQMCHKIMQSSVIDA